MKDLLQYEGAVCSPSRSMFNRIAIVGFGLIGGSAGAGAAARLGAVPHRRHRPRAVVDARCDSRAADEGGDDLGLADGADLIVLAAPVRQNISVLRDLVKRVRGTPSSPMSAVRSAPSWTPRGICPYGCLRWRSSARRCRDRRPRGGARGPLSRPALDPDRGRHENDVVRRREFQHDVLPKGADKQAGRGVSYA